DPASRLDAIQGLAHSAGTNVETRQLLLGLLKAQRFERDALRSLRGVTTNDEPAAHEWLRSLRLRAFASADEEDERFEQAERSVGPKRPGQQGVWRPPSVQAWQEYLSQHKGDRAAGERVFFHPKGPRCFACHRIDGRGEAIGPDLSHVGSALKRDKLIEAILEPSKEIAPAFVTWLVTTRDGKQHVGIIIGEGAHSTL